MLLRGEITEAQGLFPLDKAPIWSLTKSISLKPQNSHSSLLLCPRRPPLHSGMLPSCGIGDESSSWRNDFPWGQLSPLRLSVEWQLPPAPDGVIWGPVEKNCGWKLWGLKWTGLLPSASLTVWVNLSQGIQSLLIKPEQVSFSLMRYIARFQKINFTESHIKPQGI